MKKVLILFPFLLYASVLSNLKQKEINLDKLKSIQSSIETKNSWINPIMLTYSINKDDSTGVITTTKQFSITVNQPIFKSGAIYYSIKYANVLKNYNLKQIELQKRALIKQALDLAYDYKINQLNEKILFYQIQNAKINVKRKKDAFLSGTGDSSDLDNAILNLNNLKLSLNDVKISQNDIKYSFKKISDLKIDKITLPKFKLITKREFLNSNLELITQKQLKQMNLYLYKMKKGNQLITVSLNLSYNRQSVKNAFSSNKNNYYTFGFSFSFPLDINAKPRIEQAKLDYLKSQTMILDKKRELLNTFENIIKDIALMKQKLKIYDQNIKIYDNLIKSTKDSIKAGSATLYDLEILENSKETLILNKKIINLQIQKKLLNLYYNLLSFAY